MIIPAAAISIDVERSDVEGVPDDGTVIVLLIESVGDMEGSVSVGEVGVGLVEEGSGGEGTAGKEGREQRHE